jgi:hypothetical protein
MQASIEAIREITIRHMHIFVLIPRCRAVLWVLYAAFVGEGINGLSGLLFVDRHSATTRRGWFYGFTPPGGLVSSFPAHQVKEVIGAVRAEPALGPGTAARIYDPLGARYLVFMG